MKETAAVIVGVAAVIITVVVCITVYQIRMIERQRYMDTAALAAGMCQVQNVGLGNTWPNYHYEKCK